MAIRKVTIIGAGRVAVHLGKSLFSKGFEILQVYSRTMESATGLAKQLHCQAVNVLSEIREGADLYIISVPDDAIEDVASHLNFRNGTVVHTSGSMPMRVLEQASPNHGVIWPLQSFSFDRTPDFSEIPMCIEASSKSVEQELVGFTGHISDNIRLLDGQQRAVVHLAAVIANNFTNLMYLLSDEVLKSVHVNFDILIPIIRETAFRTAGHHPEETQTGPAVRNDVKIIEKHLQMLGSDPEKKEIYRLLTGYITNYFNTKKGNQS